MRKGYYAYNTQEDVDLWELIIFTSRHVIGCQGVPRGSICSCGPQFKGLQNLKTLYKLLKWNHSRNLNIHVLPSTLFPGAADIYQGYTLGYASKRLRRIGRAVSNWKTRLILIVPDEISSKMDGSNHSRVIISRYIHYCASVLNYMNVDRNSLVIIRLKDDQDFLHELHDWLSALSPIIRNRIAFLSDNDRVHRVISYCENERVALVVTLTSQSRVPQPSVQRLWKSLQMKPLAFTRSTLGSNRYLRKWDLVVVKNDNVDTKNILSELP